MSRILVVEDNEVNRYLIKFILNNGGYDIIEAIDGNTGVLLAIQDKFDLVIMDIQLPDINGMEATKRIRASAVHSDVPIVARTSYAMVGDREKALAAGMTGYIEKPINPDTFLTEIKKLL